MSLTATEIVFLMKQAKELGLTTIKVDGFEAQLATPMPIKQPEVMTDIDDKDLVVPSSPFDDLSDEEILYFATPYYDELQAKKEAQAQKLKEEEATRGKEG